MVFRPQCRIYSIDQNERKKPMLILDYPGWEKPTLYESLFPSELFELTPELEKINELLKDEVFERPILERYETTVGRPTVPVRVYIRLMVLKFYLALSFEELFLTVSKTPMHKKFCRIPMDQSVPTDTALMKITKKYGPEIVHELNDNLIMKLRADKVIKARRLRVDTTVVEANIEYPTDADLLYKGVEKLDRAVSKARTRSGENVRKGSKKKRKK